MVATKRPTGHETPAALDEYRRKRDFSRTNEPAGDANAHADKAVLQFVIQKHAASHLHFDFRLELDGVMKSWAVPKGPSLDPAVKRLAMQVEDHPIEYNQFEGTIPKGEYGGGTVMLWDRGRYAPDRDAGARTADDRSDQQILRDEYERGDLKFVLYGKRLEGSWVLVRTRLRTGSSATKPQWLLIKHRDAYARRGSDITAEVDTSVATGHTMGEIAGDAEGISDSESSRSTIAQRAMARPARKGPRNATAPRKPARKKATQRAAAPAPRPARGGSKSTGRSSAAGPSTSRRRREQT
jgi:bifunctional non-homologous end joining protein LigD